MSKENKIAIGTFWRESGILRQTHILARVSVNQGALISIEVGDRWANAIDIKDFNNISKTELKSLMGGYVFHEVKKPF